MRPRMLTVVCLLALVPVAYRYFQGMGLEGDTDAMIREVRAAVACVAQGSFGNCPEAGQFPLLQKLPTLPLVLLGLKTGLIQRLLALLSFAAFVAMLRSGLKFLAPDRRWAFAAVLLLSPMLWYARSSFGEALSALCLLQLILALLEGKAAQIFLFALAAAISKETVPFCVPILATGALINVKKAMPLVAGLFAGAALNSAQNLFRFGTLANQSYLHSYNLVTDPAQVISSFAGLWLSPSGGLLLFWPSFAFLLFYASITKVRPQTALVASLATLAALTLGFSRWAFPFGWVCWGPRFFIPWVPAIVLLLTHSYPMPMPSRKLYAALAVVSLPQFVALFDPNILERLFYYNAQCPTEAVIERGRDYYFQCLNHWIWPERLELLHGYLPTVASAFAVAALAIVYWFTTEPLRRRS